MSGFLLFTADGKLKFSEDEKLQFVSSSVPEASCCECEPPGLCLREDAPNFYGVEFHMDFDVSAPTPCYYPLGFPRTIHVFGSATWTRFLADYTVSSSATLVIDGVTYSDEDFTVLHTCGFGRFVVDLYPAAPPNPSGITGVTIRLVFNPDGTLYSITFGNCVGFPVLPGTGTATLIY